MNETQKQTAKETRGRYQVVHNKSTKQYHIRRLARGGQVLWNTEGYDNQKDALLSLTYPGFEIGKDFIETVEQ